jgi:hypothetical protein
MCGVDRTVGGAGETRRVARDVLDVDAVSVENSLLVHVGKSVEVLIGLLKRIARGPCLPIYPRRHVTSPVLEHVVSRPLGPIREQRKWPYVRAARRQW